MKPPYSSGMVDPSNPGLPLYPSAMASTPVQVINTVKHRVYFRIKERKAHIHHHLLLFIEVFRREKYFPEPFL